MEQVMDQVMDQATGIAQATAQAPEISLLRTGADPSEFAELVSLAFLSDLTQLGDRVFKKAVQGVDRMFLPKGSRLVPAWDESELGGIDLNQRRVRQGSVARVRSWLQETGGAISEETEKLLKELAAAEDETVLLLADQFRDLGVVRIRVGSFGLLTAMLAWFSFKGL